MTYEEKCALLGIQRPESLTKGFKEDRASIAIAEKGKPKLIGPRVPGPELTDLSHLNPKCGKGCQEQTKRWWASLTKEERAAMNRARFERLQKRRKHFWHTQSK